MAKILLLLLPVVSGKLIGAGVLPHGDFAYDPSLVNNTGGSVHLHEMSLRLGRDIASFRPEIIFLSTPHGLELSERYLVYLNARDAGSSPLDDSPAGKGRQVLMNFSTPTKVALELLSALQAENLPVEGLRGFSDARPLPVSWGEILPLSYVRAAADGQLPPVLPMSFPLRRFNHSAEMVEELLHLGRTAWSFLEKLPQRVYWLVSADLAHTHLKSGPYGFCPCAQPFDDAVGRWVSTSNASSLLVEARRLQRAGAMSCGFTGLVALQGALSHASQWAGELWANAHPTYYGMMVAKFTLPDVIMV